MLPSTSDWQDRVLLLAATGILAVLVRATDALFAYH
jgi:hypothetical protein